MVGNNPYRARSVISSDLAARTFAVLVLFLSTSALIQLLLYPSGTLESYDPVEGNPVSQLMWLGIYGITFVLILRRWRQYVYFVTVDKFLLALVGITLCSILWSAAPEVTLRRNVALAGTTMIGFYLAMRYSLSELLRLLAWAMGLAALLSLAFAVALPSYGIDNHSVGADWQGIYGGGKNVLGRNMSLGALVFLLLALSVRRYRWLAWSGFGVSVVVLLASNSVTSWITLLIVAALLLPYAALRWRYTLALPCLLAALAVAVIAAVWLQGNVGDLLAAFGRDSTLTGRTDIWPAVLEMIRERPWLGYGYGGFWLGWEGESANIWHWTSHQSVHAHNGFLEVWLNLGLLGLSVFVLGFLVAVGRAIIWARMTKSADGLWPLAYLTFMLLYNLTEVSILVRNSIFWILYVVIVVTMAAQLSAVRGAKPLAPEYRGVPSSAG